MCGLYGYSTKEGATLTKKQRELRGRILTGLALAMQERGTHSTGVAGVCKEHEWHLLKQAASATEFVKTKEYQNFIAHDPRVVIGHTRFATVGAVINDNAHPFNEGNIVGAHNGSVSNWKDVYPEGTVDSQAIFHNLNQHDNKFKKALKEVRGRFAITWFDQRNTDKLYIVRDVNPLSIVRIPELETYFWASLLYPLQAVLASHFDLSKTTIWTPKDEYVYEMTGQHKIKKTKIEFGKYIAPASTYNYNESWRDTWDKDWNKGKKNVFENRFDDKESEREEILRLTERGNHSRIMDLTEREMRMIDDQGIECQMCQKQIDPENETLSWHSIDEAILCYSCSDALDDWEQCVLLDHDDLLDIKAELMFLDKEEQLEREELEGKAESEVDPYA